MPNKLLYGRSSKTELMSMSIILEVKMNREIKFRVWSESDKEYRADLLSKLIPPFITADYNDEGDRFEIEQYTGLKDKNGKEIYEGDIIRYKLLRDDCSTRHGYKYREVIEAVKYDNEFGMYITEPYSSLGTIVNHYEPEVIGNIHEDQELLGGEK